MNLDNLDIAKLDPKGVIESIRKFPDQMEHLWNQVMSQDFPETHKTPREIIVCGMGGSALGGRVVKFLTRDSLRAPIEICTEFNLPSYADGETLVILSSYSGNTQETISAAHEAIQKGCHCVGVTTGGQLKEILEKNSIPMILIDTVDNPAGQPRLGVGYSAASILALLTKLQFLSISNEEMQEVISFIRSYLTSVDTNSPEGQNMAKMMAHELYQTSPVLIASEHLMGAAHVFKNQLNESAKTFTSLYDIPELNHHLMEGLAHPTEMTKFLRFVFINSSLYGSEVQKRYPITNEVVEKNNIKTLSYNLVSDKKIQQVFELIVFGSFVQYYLAMLYNVDPSTIPWVDYFKEKLK